MLEAICIIVYIIDIGIAGASHNIRPATEREHDRYWEGRQDSQQKNAGDFENYLHLLW